MSGEPALEEAVDLLHDKLQMNESIHLITCVGIVCDFLNFTFILIF